MAETKCDKTYSMGVFNSVTNEVEDIEYPCKMQAGHETMSAHEFTKDGTTYSWLDPEQVKALRK